MFKLIIHKDKKAHKRLLRAQKAVDKFSEKHPGSFSKRKHKKLRKLLSNRATALSKATGMKVHSLFD